jgi:hypothetical protein
MFRCENVAPPPSSLHHREIVMAAQHLTNSRYLAGLQCPRRLWLLVHEPAAYEAPAPGSPLDVGQEIGDKAHLLFPGGVLVEEKPWQHAEAVLRTASLMANASVPAIFEAAFEHDGIRIHVDALERLGHGTWGLREVKSSGSIKDHHADDLALQAFVLAGVGVAVASIELLHVNTDYVRDARGICWPAFFVRVDARRGLGGARRSARPAARDARVPGAGGVSRCRAGNAMRHAV